MGRIHWVMKTTCKVYQSEFIYYVFLNYSTLRLLFSDGNVLLVTHGHQTNIKNVALVLGKDKLENGVKFFINGTHQQSPQILKLNSRHKMQHFVICEYEYN